MEEAGAALMGRGPTWRPARLPRVCSVTLSPLLPLCLAPSVVLGWLAACETGRDTRSFVELLLDAWSSQVSISTTPPALTPASLVGILLLLIATNRAKRSSWE